MKLIKTIEKLVEDAEREYFTACDRCADEKTLTKLEKNYQDTLDLMRKLNKMKGKK